MVLPGDPDPTPLLTFDICGIYRAGVYRESSSTYSIQVFHKDTGSPLFERPNRPLPFQAYRTIVSDTVAMWTPCWTEATDFEPDGTFKVFYTYDKLSRMKFVETRNNTCVATLSHKIMLEHGG